MPNRTLALDLGGPMLRAALVESTLRAHRVLGVWAVPRPENGGLRAALQALATTHGVTWDEVVSALPGERVTHRILTLPFRDRRRLDQAVPFELESHVPFDVDESVIDYHVLGGRNGSVQVLAALAPKDTVREHLATLAAAGIDPRVVDLAPLAALNLLRQGGAPAPGRSGFVDASGTRTCVALLDGGTLVGLRTLGTAVTDPADVPATVAEVRWSLAALAGEAEPALGALWLAGDAAGTPGLAPALAEALGVAPRGLAELAVGSVPPTLRREQPAFATALGLALRESAAADALGVDFRRGEFAYHREREALWRGLRRAGILAALACVLMVASYVLEGRRLEARHQALRAEMRALFTAALPEVRTIVDEKAQLTAEIAALEKQRALTARLAPDAVHALDVLRALTEGAPEDVGLDLQELSIDAETVRLQGSTRAYEGVEAVKRGLAARPELADVEVKDVRATVDGQRVGFRLSLTLAGSRTP